MPRRLILSGTEYSDLLAIPKNQDDLIRYYTFSEPDVSLIRQRRGDPNRFGFAVQLCLLRYPGFSLSSELKIPDELLEWISGQISVDKSAWSQYAERDETRREHVQELRSYLGLDSFGSSDFEFLASSLIEVAMQTDKGLLLATQALELLRQKKYILPSLSVIDRACKKAITAANRKIYKALTENLSSAHKERLDDLLKLRADSSFSWITWLREPPKKNNSRGMLEHIERLKKFQSINLPENMGGHIHRNRLLKMAREGGQMTAANLMKFEEDRRYATLIAIVLEGMATVTDELVDLHDRILIKLFSAAKKKHNEQFNQDGKAINDKVRLYSKIGHALMEAKKKEEDPFVAIEKIISWEDFEKSVAEADNLAQPESFDHFYLLNEQYATLRRYTPKFLEVLDLRASSVAQELLDGIEVIREMNITNSNKVLDDAPTSFIRPRWKPMVFTKNGIDRRFYEICALSELKNSLRSGDVWVKGSRQFRNFEEYLLPMPKFDELKLNKALPIAINSDCDEYLTERMKLVEEQLVLTNKLAAADQLPEAIITTTGLKITPLETIVPEEAQSLIDQTAMLLPRIKITDLLMDVDDWTGFSRHFTHLKDGEAPKDRRLLLSVILADAINLGLVKMAECSPGMTFAKLSWLQAWHIRDETYSTALAEIVNAQSSHSFSEHWGDGTTSSSDGQRFRTANRAENHGYTNPKYGREPGKSIYTHLSDQYAPFHANIMDITTGLRDSSYVLDGLLYHESDLRIEEHYTDTAGFSDHIFALMHLLGFRFAPRIRDLKETKLYIPGHSENYPALAPMIGDVFDLKKIRSQWDEILRLASSIKQGTVTASLIVKKISSYPRQNGLALALRELGRIERTLFILDWLQSIELRRRVHAGLNKGEARNALARALFFNRLGEIRDHGFEQQRYRASGLNLVTAAIGLWNTVYLDRAVEKLHELGKEVPLHLLRHLSPLGWGHINFTGDYVWRPEQRNTKGEFRPLRTGQKS